MNKISALRDKAVLWTVAAASAALMFFAPAANASTVIYNFDGSSMVPAFTAQVSLDVTGGQASSGIGTIDFSGNLFDLTLITLATPGGDYGGVTGYRDNHGTDIFGGDTAIPIDINGLIFAISNSPAVGADALFAAWNNGDGSFSLLISGTLPGIFNLYYEISRGSAAIAATPLPSTWLMLIGGLAGLGFFGYRGARKQPDLAFAAI